MSKNHVFIVSGGRTGTQYFGDLLTEVIEDTFSVHEPDLADPTNPARMWRAIRAFGFYHMVWGRLTGRTGIRNIAQRWISGALDRDTAIAAMRRHRDAYHSAISATLIIESYSQWYGLAELVPEAYPGAKIIGLVRDPRDWVTSWLNHGGQYDLRDLTGFFRQPRLSPADFGQTELAARWAKASRFEKHCWDWQMINRHITDAAAKSDTMRIWRFEDVFTAPDPLHLNELLAFAAQHPDRAYAISFDPARRHDRRNTSQGRAPRWKDWTAEQAVCLDRHCGDLMRHYGYGQEPEWRAKLAAASHE